MDKKEPVWIEVDEIPQGTINENKLLIPGHKFIRLQRNGGGDESIE